MKRKTMLLFMYALIFLFSFGFIGYSALMPAIRTEYHLSMSQAGWIGSVLAAGQFVILLFNDFLAKRFTQLMLMLFCFLAYMLSMICICLTPPYIALLVSYFIIGMAISLINVVMSAQISMMYGEKRDRYLNYFHGVYGIGSMTGPLLPAAVTAAKMPWITSYVIIVVICSAFLLLFFRLDLKADAGTPALVGEGSLGLLKDKRLLLICGASLMSMGMDMTVCSWISSYLVDVKQMSEAAAGLGVTIYWIGASSGRLLYPTLFGKFDTKHYLIVANLAAAVIFGSSSLFGGIWVNAGLAAVGFATGSGIPLLIGMGCALKPDSSVSVTNDLMIAGAIGGTVFPWLAGWLTGLAGYGGFLWVTIALFLGLAAIMADLCRRQENGREV